MGLLTIPIVLSPSGMLKASALMQKPLKKKYFLKAFRLLKIHHQFTFHAVDDAESREITNIFGNTPVIHQVYYAPPAAEERIILPAKIKGTVDLVFIGRVHPLKNLHFLLECLRRTTHIINITIIGPVEDKAYYDQCRQLEQGLRENVRLHYTGGIPNEAIKSHLRKHHFLIHPSLGENFGYAIVEAFCQGRPAIISDRTPWKNMEAQKTGMDIPLNDHGPFIDAINRAANMEQEEYHTWCEAAWNFSRFSLQRPVYKDQYIEMFSRYKE